jgi:ubiquinone/menaquinone biosynthesis C-methylase UbiE
MLTLASVAASRYLLPQAELATIIGTMKQTASRTMRDNKELAYLYDLFVTPIWREAFDQIVDQEVKLPREGKILDAGCGTGGYAIALSAKLGAKAEVVGIDSCAERLELARAKASVHKLSNVSFTQGSMSALGCADQEFDLVIGDVSLLGPEEIRPTLAELVRVAKPGATVVLKLSTRGSFDEFFSIYWEALHDLGLEEFTPRLEELITERLTVSQVEELAAQAGLKHVRSVTRKERFDSQDAQTFLTSPLIEDYFLHHWLQILPDQLTRERVRAALVRIIDEERHQMDFDVSIKATLLIGKK